MAKQGHQTDREMLLRSIGNGKMTRDQLVACLEELAERVSETGVQARLILLGGAALSICYDRPQATVDIDAVASPSDPIMEVVAIMAARYGLQQKWLNQDAVGFMPHEDFQTTLVIDRPGVSIEAAPADVLLAMKLRECRPAKDGYDIAWLLRKCNIRSVDEAIAHLELFFPEEELPEGGATLVDALLGEVELPTLPPTVLPAVMPRDPASTCLYWVLKKDRRCTLPLGHDGDHV
jgi:hypothetical protein